jgi:SH3-like domain-containing protein
MLKYKKVNVRYGPSFDYPVKFIYKKTFLPVKVIDKKENFRRIIDHKKNSGWIHITQLKKVNSLIVLEDKIVFKKNSGWIHITQLRKVNSLIVLEDKIVFKKNSKFSKPIVKLEKGRLVLVTKCISDWCKIKTNDYSGWLQVNNVWGEIR